MQPSVQRKSLYRDHVKELNFLICRTVSSFFRGLQFYLVARLKSNLQSRFQRGNGSLLSLHGSAQGINGLGYSCLRMIVGDLGDK